MEAARRRVRRRFSIAGARPEASPAALLAKVRRLERVQAGRKPERKVHDVATTGFVGATQAGVSSHLTEINTGDTVSTRDGNQINIKSLWVRGSVNWGGTNTRDEIRIIILRWNDNSAFTGAVVENQAVGTATERTVVPAPN